MKQKKVIFFLVMLNIITISGLILVLKSKNTVTNQAIINKTQTTSTGDIVIVTTGALTQADYDKYFDGVSFFLTKNEFDNLFVKYDFLKAQPSALNDIINNIVFFNLLSTNEKKEYLFLTVDTLSKNNFMLDEKIFPNILKINNKADFKTIFTEYENNTKFLGLNYLDYSKNTDKLLLNYGENIVFNSGNKSFNFTNYFNIVSACNVFKTSKIGDNYLIENSNYTKESVDSSMLVLDKNFINSQLSELNATILTKDELNSYDKNSSPYLLLLSSAYYYLDGDSNYSQKFFDIFKTTYNIDFDNREFSLYFLMKTNKGEMSKFDCNNVFKSF